MSGTNDQRTPSAAIYGCEGLDLSAAEADFFRAADPFGFILFARNCQTPDQIRELVTALRESVGRPEAPVLIDQEGGRVARLKPPQWRAAPPASYFGRMASHDRARAHEALRINTTLLAAELADLGIDVDCVPLLDLHFLGAHDVIGDRAFGGDPDLVADLGRIVCETMLEGLAAASASASTDSTLVTSSCQTPTRRPMARIWPAVSSAPRALR
jgi:beta-N-acetylhexosaminidase